MNEQELFKLCYQRAQAIVLAAKCEYSPGGIVDDARNDVGGADPKAPTPVESADQQMAAYNKYLPHILNSVIGAIQPFDQDTTASLKQSAPQIAQLQNDVN